MSVGTGLWVLQLGLWHAVQAAPGSWFRPQPFVLAWAIAAAGSAVALLSARWLPSPAGVNAAMVAQALEWLAPQPDERVLDLLTGSGMRPVSIELAREVASRVAIEVEDGGNAGEAPHGDSELAH